MGHIGGRVKERTNQQVNKGCVKGEVESSVNDKSNSLRIRTQIVWLAGLWHLITLDVQTNGC